MTFSISVVKKTLIAMAIGTAIGLSPSRNSQAIEFLVITMKRLVKMWNIIMDNAGYLFPGTRMFKLIMDGYNLTNQVNPVVFDKNIILAVIDCCAPPQLKWAAHCIEVVAIVETFIICPNLKHINFIIHLITEINEK